MRKWKFKKEVNKTKIHKYYFPRTKGKTLIELISALSISVLITMIIINIYAKSMKNYNETQQYHSEVTAIYEALMYIDYYINRCSSNYYVKDQRIFLKEQEDLEMSYIFLQGNEIRVAYKNELSSGYTSQPLLYDVREFSLEENEKVIFIKIVTNKGNEGRKAVGRN